MASNPDQPESPFSHLPQHSGGTAGEFTQIFFSGGSSQPTPNQSLPFASPADDFDALFSGASQPTQTPAPADRSSEATLIFQAIPAEAARPVTTPLPAVEIPSRQAVNATESPSRATQIPSSEFTQIFTPIAPPAVPPPAVMAASMPPSGEFTQFFSAISARQSAIPTPPESVAPGSAASPQPADHGLLERAAGATAGGGSFTQLFQQAPAVSSAPQTPVRQVPAFQEAARVAPIADAGGAFTQVFPQSPSAPQVNPSASASDAGSFTQIFQQIPPPPASPNAGAMSPDRAPAASPIGSRPNPMKAPAPAGPAFGPPPPPSGTFTDVFASQPYGSPAVAPRVSHPPVINSSAAQGEAFTELFQANPTPPQADASPFGSFGAGQNAGWPASAPPPPGSGWSGTQAPAESPLASGGGEFTRLMQSLNPSGGPGAAPAVSNDSFFAPPAGMASGSSQESEYTRVQRGSSQRDAAPPPAKIAIPAASNASAPGMAMEPAKAKPEDKGAPKKSKTLIILLVVMNAILLIALIAIGLLVLHRK